MKNFLVTFTAPDGQGGTIYGSHVLLLDRMPRTPSERGDIRMILSLEPNYETMYGLRCQAIIELPYQDGSRTSGPYGYRLTYMVVSPTTRLVNVGSKAHARPRPIHTLQDLRNVESCLVAGRPDTYIRLTQCTALRLNAEQLRNIERQSRE